MLKIFTLISFTFLCIQLSAQQLDCGIYRTVDDFRSKHVSVAVDCSKYKKAITLIPFTLRPYVLVKTQKGELKFQKDSIYAVCNCNHSIYRIWKQKEYELLDTGRLMIYTYTSYVNTITNKASPHARFEKKQTVHYFFSIRDNAAIYPLTLTNLQLVFISDKVIEEQLSSAFANNASLICRHGNRFDINKILSDIKLK